MICTLFFVAGLLTSFAIALLAGLIIGTNGLKDEEKE